MHRSPETGISKVLTSQVTCVTLSDLGTVSGNSIVNIESNKLKTNAKHIQIDGNLSTVKDSGEGNSHGMKKGGGGVE